MIGNIEKNMLVQDIQTVLQKYNIQSGIFCLLVNDELIQFAVTQNNQHHTNEIIMKISAQLNELMKAHATKTLKPVIN